MSRKNVEIVRSLHPAPGTDMAHNFRDDGRWAAVRAALAPALAPDFHCTGWGYLEADGEIFAGLDGLREGWLDWLTPWESYRTEVEEIIDLGDDVLVLVRDFGRRSGETGEVAITSANVWSLQDGKVARLTFFADRATALKAVGLEQ